MQTLKRLALTCSLITLVGFTGHPRAAEPTATLHVVGDLPGGGALTVVRDVTRVGGTLYAVGGAVSRLNCVPPGCFIPPATDTAFLWQFDGTTATMQALPDIDPFPSATNGVNGGWDITPDARYIGSVARTTTPTTIRAVKVDRLALPAATANLNLNATKLPELNLNTAAVAGSNDGAIYYANGAGPRAIRFDSAPGGATTGFIPPLGTDTQNNVAFRGTSANGDVAVGASIGSTGSTRAYRYVHTGLGAGVSTEIPRLPGGAFNGAVAVSPDGDLVLVAGHNPDHATVELYTWKASTGAIVRLGTPNGASSWSPGGRICGGDFCSPGRVQSAGMTPDASVVAATFGGADGQHAYVRNQHGWFHLENVLLANGIDLAADGWNPAVVITGMSADATLVFGSGSHHGVAKGFIAEFAPGVLAGFNPQAAPPANSSIVGAWSCDGDAPPQCALVFTDQGVYYQIEQEPGGARIGFERGLYTFDGTHLRLTTLFDSNGSFGASGANGTSLPVILTANTLGTEEEGVFASRIVGSPGSLAGAWTGGVPTEVHDSLALVFTDTGLLEAYDLSDGFDAGIGTYTWDPVSHELVATFGSEIDDGNFATMSPNGLVLHVVHDDGGETFDLVRVIDPATIPAVTNPQLFASGVVGQAFSYDVDATNTTTFSATGLPDGLSIDAGTGMISGIPAVGGQFPATVFATSSIGVSDIETVVLTIAIPTPVGQGVVVTPEVPEGQGPVTVTFDQVTGGGTTTVTVLDLEESGIPPPGNVSVGGVIYEVTTTATYQGLITLCFSYDGIDFGTAEPRLFHYENNVWVDITTSVDPVTKTICGATTSLSPFAILVSHVVRTGFYAPVNPMAGFLNTAKGGSTVPLKFNVSVDGVNQTTTAGLSVTQQPIPCDGSAPEDPVEPAATAGNSGLSYTGNSFHYNWKVPKTAGVCYMVRVTTAQDGLALTARFKAK